MSTNTILIISGTNRPQANALKTARVLEAEYRYLGVAAEVLSLAEMSSEVFDPSSYATQPPGMVAIQERVLAAAGLHIVTPEYNGSFPGVLKYFIDMLKFPESFDRKCVAFLGESLGVWGGLRSVEQLIQIFGYRNAHIYPERVFISDVKSKFSDDGRILDAALHQRIKTQVAGFRQFVTSLKGAG
jgi:chromate reductase, NAD(P)H dehydrogenase (quinone)